LTKYSDELQSYTECFDEVADALLTVFMWRGHFPITLGFFKKKWTFKVPLHSMIAFTWGIILAHDFEKIFSFLCFWVAWVLLATLDFRMSNPNPWKRPRSYLELLGILLFNKSFVRVEVRPNENIEAILQHDEQLAERLRMRNLALENMRVEKENNEKRLQEEGEALDQYDLDPTTKMTGGLAQIALAPFKSVLFPAQMTLYRVCVTLRVASSIILWNDSIAAFWIVTVALLSSLLVAWIPWAFIFRWGFKIFVYVVLGPWMKLVDIFYVHKLQNMTPGELKAKAEADYQRRYDLLLGETYIRKLLKENWLKLQDITKYMFGEASTVVDYWGYEGFISSPHNVTFFSI
jgi:hypothetical protein